MSETTETTTVTTTVVTPLPALTLADLRASVAKPIAALSVAARLAKLFQFDLTPYISLVQGVVANDDVMDVVLEGVNFARAEGVDLATVVAWVESRFVKKA